MPKLKAANNSNFEMIAKTYHGLEDVLAKELLQLGAQDIKTLRRAVKFKGDVGFMYKANLSLRTAVRIIKPIKTFKVSNETEFYDSIRAIDWSQYMTIDDKFAVDAFVNSTYFNHSLYIALKTKDAIVDHFRDLTGDRPDIEIKRPQVLIDLYISNTEVTISVNTSGNPLFQRGYRNASGEAPINEVVAASLIRMSGWDRKTTLLDPFCGSGTLLIEGALLASGIPSNIERQHYAFKNFKNFDQKLWDEIYDNATRIVRELPCRFIGSDISDEMVLKSRRNLREFSFGRFIEISGKPFNEVEKTDEPLFIISNPPYGQRLELDEELYSEIGTWLKHEIKEGTACIISSSEEGFKSIGLKHSKKVKVYNGNLDCSFRSYELFEGKRKDTIS